MTSAQAREMMQGGRLMPLAMGPTILMLLIVALYFVAQSEVSDEGMFYFLIASLAAYLAAEVFVHARSDPRRWMISPPFLASILTFGLGFVACFVPPWLSQFARLDISGFSNQALLLALIASYSMWRGFDIPLGSHFARKLYRVGAIRRFIQEDEDLNVGVILLLVALAIISRLALTWLGIYGYNADPESLAAAQAYKQYLYYLDVGGKLALLAVAVSHFAPTNQSRQHRVLLYAILAEEIFFGILSGFKGQIVLPLILVTIVQYIKQGRINRGLVVAIVAVLILGYALIEPYRILRYENPNFQNDSVTGIVGEMAGVARSREFGDGAMNAEVLAQIFQRGDLLMVTSRGIEFLSDGPLPEDSPQFLRQVLLAPVLAIVPRILWANKPTEEIGGWFNQIVLQQPGDTITSVGMGPIVYLYYAGGTLMVILGFVLIGVLQRFAGELILVGGGAALIGFAILRPLIVVDSAYNTILVSLIREVPLVLLAQAIIFAGKSGRVTGR